MDGNRFDELTRGLAIGRTRRSVLRGMIGGGAALAASRIGVTLARPAPQVTICHYHDDFGVWGLITINQNAAQTHYDHGDPNDSSLCCTSDYPCEAQCEHVDCVWSEWQKPSECPAECGPNAVWTLTRTIAIPASCGGTECDGPSELEEPCGIECSCGDDQCGVPACTDAGTCTCSPKDCSDGQDCTTDSCDPRDGQCVHEDRCPKGTGHVNSFCNADTNACDCNPTPCGVDECGPDVPDGCGSVKDDCPNCPAPQCTDIDLSACDPPSTLCREAWCNAGTCAERVKTLNCSTTPVGECEIARCDPATGDCGIFTANNGTSCDGGFCNAGVCAECSGSLGCNVLERETCCNGTCISGFNITCCGGTTPCASSLCQDGNCCDVSCGADICCRPAQTCVEGEDRGVPTFRCLPPL